MHPTQLGGNHAAIDDVRCYQTHQPSFFRGDLSRIRNHCIRVAGLVERQRARAAHKFSRVDIGGGRHQPVHVHFRVLPEQHAVLVNDDHVAVRRQVAIDTAGAVTVHAVQGNACATRLHELCRLTGTDIKPAPVDHRFVAGLVHRQRITRGGDARRSRRYHAAFRIGERKLRQHA